MRPVPCCPTCHRPLPVEGEAADRAPAHRLPIHRRVHRRARVRAVAHRDRARAQLRVAVEGITASEVVSEGITAGVLWGEASFIERYPRVYAWVGPWLSQVARRGGLAPKLVDVPGGGKLQVTRTSDRGASHRNRNGVYLDPEFAGG